MPAFLTKLGVVLAGILALALWMTGVDAAAADAACQARAEAVPHAVGGSTPPLPGTYLSTPLSIEVTCDLSTEINLRLPGGDSSGHSVDSAAPLRINGERAYLCHGQDASVQVTSTSLGWSESIPIDGIDAIPQCDVMLRRGATWVEWTGPRLELREAFAGRALGWVNWGARSRRHRPRTVRLVVR